VNCGKVPASKFAMRSAAGVEPTSMLGDFLVVSAEAVEGVANAPNGGWPKPAAVAETATKPVPDSAASAAVPPVTATPPAKPTEKQPPAAAPVTAAAPAPAPADTPVEAAIRRWFPENFEKASDVAWCESRHDPGAVSPGGGNHGLFQINSVHRAEFEAVTGVSWDAGIYDASLNAQYARALFDQQGWAPWACG
jgi:hypothetical protein